MLRIASIANRRSIIRMVLVLAMAATATVLIPTTSAFAAPISFSVTTTADVTTGTGACGNSGIVVAPSPLSLREATCLANNVGGTVTINVPAGTYNLSNGEVAPGQHNGQTVTITGAGSASTIVNGQGLSRVFDIDPNSEGGVNSNLSGMTVTNGSDSTFGGAGILAGSGNSETSDVMTMTNMIVTGNHADVESPSTTNQPGGGMQFLGGQLTVTNVTFSSNSSNSSPGSGLVYSAQGSVSPESLTITNSTFSGNTATNSNESTSVPNGGALALLGNAGTYTVTDTKFFNNTVTATTGPAVGGGIWVQSGTLTVNRSTFTGNTVAGGSGSPAGSAIYTQSENTTTLRYNRIVGNSAATGSSVQTAGGTLDAASNWWGCNAGPGQAGCDTVTAGATVSPRLVLTAAASPSTVVGPNGTSLVHALLTTDSAGGSVTAGNLSAFDALPATFSDPPGDATVGGTAGDKLRSFDGGDAGVSYQSNTTTGTNPVNVTFDNATVTANINITQPPAITSASTAHFDLNSAGSFTVTTTGSPAPAITRTGTLPAGVTFVDNGDGTATLSGTPTAGGSFPLTLTANNGVAPNATQTLTLTVGQAPAFTSASTAAFTIGVAGSFTVTTSGLPTVSTITESGALPAGMTFTDNGNGTATLAGTPTGTGNTYPVTLTATNGIAPNGSQALSIQVNQAPAVTTDPSDQTVQPATSVTFFAAASGVPAPTVQWQRSTDGGGSFTNVAGATSASYTFTAVAGDDGNQYRAVFTNLVSSATTTAATLHVGTAPAFTSADHTTFAVGTAGSFNITTTGLPSATLSRTGAQFPAWLTLTDNGDGTGTLTGTPPVGSAGQYQFTLKAANGFSPSASQVFTLFVDVSPTITSTNHATFTVGSAGAFAVTTTAGFPTSTAISETGTLPDGVTFTDNGDGTATLAGTPVAGTAGTYPITISAAAVEGVTTPATQSFTLTVNGPPTITSANHATFAVGAAGSFTVTTTAGFPNARTITKTGALPSGVTFTDNGDGTATLAGTPAFGTGGTYPITIKASNGVAPDATQSFTLTVNQPPVITSTNHATFTSGTAGAFTVTTAPGQPAATTITETGALPAGVTFTDNGDGTATLGGTPTQQGTFPLTIQASNGVLPDPTQTFTLTVNTPPSITSADHTTFRVGTAGSFTVTTAAGTPAATTITKSGGLPAGVSLTDNGDGTATLAGTPATGTGGTYPITITASNGVNPDATQSFTLNVNEPPSITSADHATFTFGTAADFTVTTAAGFPTSTAITQTGALPSGVTFADNSDGTATLTGTPTEGGVFHLTINAGNEVSPDASQAFTLTVNNSPSITSADHTTFKVGVAGSFAVTTNAGTPTELTIVETGSMPSGVSFTDNGDGTATLAGTPAVGTGGSYSLMFTASNGVIPPSTQSFTLNVNEPPAITSADHTTFTLGEAGTFSVTTTAGFPTSTAITHTGALPAGVTFVDNGDGTATLAGTPTEGGIFPLTIKAGNEVSPDASQSFTLTVNNSPSITSADHTTFAVGTVGSFTVTTTAGTPTSTTITTAGSLPAGVTFTDNGDGTATMAGTPGVATGGTYPFMITASNGVIPPTTQDFTLTVTDVPSITSADHATATVGINGSFSVSTTAGFPTATTLTQTGPLPTGITFTDNGDGTATLAGTPDVGAGDTYPLTLTATNTAGHTDQTFILTVNESPTITSVDNETLTAGTAGTFTVTTAGGFPTPALTETGALPDGVTFLDNTDGTATLAGTATSGGVFPIVITASNSVTDDDSQTFTLTVNGPPSITSGDAMTFTAGVAGTFVVTTNAGVPSTTTLSVTGDLPSGVTFTDNGDGTGTLAGTAPLSALDTYPLTVSASNGIAPDATQAFTLTIARATVVPLPPQLPGSDGSFEGVPPQTDVGSVMHLTGSGFAAGAPIVIGIYSTPMTLAHTMADSAGHFAVDVRVPNLLGRHTVVGAGRGVDNLPRYVERVTVIHAPAAVTGGGSTGDTGGGLAGTGPDTNLSTTLEWAAGLVLCGLMLLVVASRRRPAREIVRLIRLERR